MPARRSRLGRENPHVDRHALVLSHAPHAPLLENPQELRLRRHRHRADLVEKERAAVCFFEQTAFHLRGAGESAPPVPEQLALEQVLRQGGTVDCQVGPVGARAARLDQPGDDVLAGPRFTQNENSRRGFGRAPCARQETEEDAAAADGRRGAVAPLHLAGKGRHLAPQAARLERLRHAMQQLLGIHGLGEVIESPEPHGLDGVSNGRKARDEQHFRRIGLRRGNA